MKNRPALFLATLLCLLANVSWSVDVEVDETDLIQRMGLLYKKFSTETFSGTVIKYYDSGQMKQKIQYAEGAEVNAFEQYFESGQIEFKGSLKAGQRDGLWEFY